MRNTAAPNNRSLFLEEEDFTRYGRLSGIDKLEAGSPLSKIWDEIYLGDCVQGLSQLPGDCIDMVFADPPYFNKKRDFGKGSKSWDSLEDYLTWTDRWLSRVVPLLKTSASVYLCCDWEYSGAVQDVLSRGLTVMNRITWRREKGRGARRNWKNNMEDVWFAVVDADAYLFNLEAVKMRKEIIAPYTDEKGRPKDWVDRGGERYRMTHPSNIWTDLTVPFWSMPENTPHPTQKPEKLVERCIKASTNPGDVVLDPFMGSGTTAVVAARHGRHFIGFEQDDDYVRLAKKRLDTRL